MYQSLLEIKGGTFIKRSGEHVILDCQPVFIYRRFIILRGLIHFYSHLTR